MYNTVHHPGNGGKVPFHFAAFGNTKDGIQTCTFTATYDGITYDFKATLLYNQPNWICYFQPYPSNPPPQAVFTLKATFKDGETITRNDIRVGDSFGPIIRFPAPGSSNPGDHFVTYGTTVAAGGAISGTLNAIAEDRRYLDAVTGFWCLNFLAVGRGNYTLTVTNPADPPPVSIAVTIT